MDSLERRLWEKVLIGDGCWLFTAAQNGDGYGAIGIGHSQVKGAHVVAFTIWHGRPPRGLLMHTCDVRNCVRPSHLIEGTHAQNSADMVAKGRMPRGERHHLAKVSDEMFRAAVARVRTGESMQSVSESLGMSKGYMQIMMKRSTR